MCKRNGIKERAGGVGGWGGERGGEADGEGGRRGGGGGGGGVCSRFVQMLVDDFRGGEVPGDDQPQVWRGGEVHWE